MRLKYKYNKIKKNIIYPHKEALRISLIYLFFGILWILLSDKILELMVNAEVYRRIQTYKGILYVIITMVIIYFLVNNRISKLRAFQEELLINEQELLNQIKTNDNIVNHSPVIILRISEEGVVYNVNDYGCDLLGYKKEELIGSNWLDIITSEDDKEFLKEILKKIYRDEKVSGVENILIKKNGDIIDSRWSGVVDIYQDKETILAVGVDITEEKKLQSNLEKMAFRDHLTGLYNRMYLEKEIESKINSGKEFSIALLNVDNFKHVNNSVSYSVGDELLKSIASEIKKISPNDGFVVRLTGDEFVIIFNGKVLDKDIKIISSHLDKIWKIENYEFYNSVSIGVAVYPNDGNKYSTLLRSANITMERVKKSGKNNYLFYKEEFKWSNLDNVRLSKKIQGAIDNNLLEMYYQPLIDTKTGKIKSLEALIRWNDKEKGFISPGIFIPLAEETGQIYSIEKFVFKKILKQRKIFDNNGVNNISISVNLSNKTLMNKIMFNELVSIIKSFGDDFKNMTIEVTETAVISDVEKAIKNLNILRDLGFKIALDDFGTGYSSLTYLKELPIDIVKLDRSFVEKILDNKKDQLIIEALADLSNGLNYEVTVEGIETNEQFEYIRELSCDNAQGYLISRPVPIAKIDEMIDEDYTFNTKII